MRTVAYVEIEAYAVENLVNKIEANLLDVAPIWTNLKTFEWERFSNRVDILSGGFPCQPFSAAGRRQGDEDPRHLWPYIVDGIKRLQRPPVVFFENVEGIISSKLRATIGATRKELPFCFISSEKWNDWVTVQRQAYSQRVKSERRIQENEYLFSVYEMTLSNPESKSLITSSNQDQVLKMHGRLDEVRSNLNLNQVALWRTIQARDWKGAEGRSYKGLTEDLPKQTNPINKKGIALNPRWVELLMGIPTGWTMATCVNPYIIELMSLSYSETESYQQPPTELLESYGENWLTPISVEYKEIGRSMESAQKKKQKLLTHQVCFSHWPTPPASQRGDTVAIYERKSKKRESKGLCRFAPTLQVAVLLEDQKERTYEAN